MSYPFSSDYADARTLPTWNTYRITYAVTAPNGERVKGVGRTVEVSDERAYAHAMELLHCLCRPCELFTNHEVTVERV